jgi:hypothetical protein
VDTGILDPTLTTLVTPELLATAEQQANPWRQFTLHE